MPVVHSPPVTQLVTEEPMLLNSSINIIGGKMISNYNIIAKKFNTIYINRKDFRSISFLFHLLFKFVLALNCIVANIFSTTLRFITLNLSPQTYCLSLLHSNISTLREHIIGALKYILHIPPKSFSL